MIKFSLSERLKKALAPRFGCVIYEGMHTTHPVYRHLNHMITDTSALGLFKLGFDRALACWRSGCTVESITHYAQTASPKDRGVIAACEMILGWHDIAEREARAHGMSRDDAARFVADWRRIVSSREKAPRRINNARGA